MTGSGSPRTWTSTSPPNWSGCCPARRAFSASSWVADAGAEIARRSRGTPRIANRLLRRVRDYAEVRADGVITRDIAKSALEVYDVDELGLDRLDRAVLSALTRSFGGGPVGVSTLAVAVGEEATTVEEVCEPFLVRAGMIARTPAGTRRHRAGVDAPGHDAAQRSQWLGAGRTVRLGERVRN